MNQHARHRDQIARLTCGQPLPLPPLQKKALHTFADTLARVWAELRTTHPETLREGTEAEINSLLELRLNTLRDEDSRWEMLVSSVCRGRESPNYDASRLEMRPDLSFHLTRRSANFPLVAECKLIDHPHRKTISLYCREGLMRFVNGDYAWMSTEAFMLAYVRDGSSIADTLHPHLKKDAACNTLELPQAFDGPNDLARSRHQRSFTYLPPNGQPGPIVLWHLWLSTT